MKNAITICGAMNFPIRLLAICLLAGSLFAKRDGRLTLQICMLVICTLSCSGECCCDEAASNGGARCGAMGGRRFASPRTAGRAGPGSG